MSFKSFSLHRGFSPFYCGECKRAGIKHWSQNWLEKKCCMKRLDRAYRTPVIRRSFLLIISGVLPWLKRLKWIWNLKTLKNRICSVQEHMQLVQTYPYTHIWSSQMRSCVAQRNRCGEQTKKTVQVLVVVWKDNAFLRKIFQSTSRGSTDQDTVPKTTEFASSVHSIILRSRKRMNRHWWYVSGPKHSGYILVYNAKC